jgi:tetratricopeptide (TPR) repeat protein
MRENLWLTVMALLAVVIMLLLYVRTSGAEPEPPRLLPDLVADWDGMVFHFRGGDYSEARYHLQDLQEKLAPAIPVEPELIRELQIWNALVAQACGERGRATSAWERAELSGPLRVWKHLAIAAMHLERMRNDDAAEELAKAQLINPDNALVHYYLGVLYLQRAEDAIEWPDYVHMPTFRYAAFDPDVSPNTKGMYHLAATVELERAIEAAGRIDFQLPLIPPEWTADPTVCPKVGDVLLAMGAMQFEPNAHQMLAYLFLERGALEVAEEHLDRTNQLGMSAPYIFNDLGKEYESQGRHTDAARAYLKGVKNGPDRAGALLRFLQNLGDSL